MARRYLIETFGCQMNFHDSERMAGLLEALGYEHTEEAEEADLILINTCSVRERASEKLFTRLGELRPLTMSRSASHQPPIIAVSGCVAQQEGEQILKRAPFVNAVIGTQAIKRLPVILARASLRHTPIVDINPQDDVSFPLGLARRDDPVKAFVTIIEGCNDFCAFCVVPYTRGHERMRPSQEIVREVQEVVGAGRREIQLLGQIVNHYQAPDDPACDFARLLELVSEIDGVERIRFASPHPRHVTSRQIEAIRDLPKVCKHLHLPVQSGSSRILAAMRRRHSREEYLGLIENLRANIPDLAISTDIIVGFPGESAADFEQTLSLVHEVGFHSIFSFKYSVRPNTLASRRMPDDVSEEEKKQRIVALQAAQTEIQCRINQEYVGQRVAVLVDGRSRRRGWELSGRSEHNVVVNFLGAGELLGQVVPVEITEAAPHSLRGRLIHAAALDTPSVGAYV